MRKKAYVKFGDEYVISPELLSELLRTNNNIGDENIIYPLGDDVVSIPKSRAQAAVRTNKDLSVLPLKVGEWTNSLQIIEAVNGDPNVLPLMDNKVDLQKYVVLLQSTLTRFPAYTITKPTVIAGNTATVTFAGNDDGNTVDRAVPAIFFRISRNYFLGQNPCLYTIVTTCKNQAGQTLSTLPLAIYSQEGKGITGVYIPGSILSGTWNPSEAYLKGGDGASTIEVTVNGGVDSEGFSVDLVSANHLQFRKWLRAKGLDNILR